MQTAARVRQILAEHTKYAHDSRKLALDLYEGYGFRESEILVPKVRLPKYLEQARLNREMDALMARIQAARLKTPALRAGYVQMLDAILDGAGQEAIDKALDVAVHERYRYFANRIAQTELARAHHIETAREPMADETVEVVRLRLSAGHVADLCDVFAKSDCYGLGSGLYPKALSPRPVFHPFCRCTLSAELFQSAARARFDPAADAAYLRTLDPRTAARVAGSRAKRDAILQGESPAAIWNAKRPNAYRLGTVGDVLTSKPMRSEELASLAGDLTPVDLGPIHNRARDEVVRKGKETGKEHGVAVLADGRSISFGDDLASKIDAPRINAPSGSVTIHHNHPSGDSLSRADIRTLLERDELGRVDAHGHSGLWASCERAGAAMPSDAARLLVEDIAYQARSATAKAYRRGDISFEATQVGLWQVVAGLMLEKHGVLRYSLNSESVLSMARKVIE